MRHLIIHVPPIIDLSYVFNKFYEIIRDEFHSFWEEAIFTNRKTVDLKNYEITLHFISGDEPRELIGLKSFKDYELNSPNYTDIRQLANDVVKDCRGLRYELKINKHFTNDLLSQMEFYSRMFNNNILLPIIIKVISSDPATIVFWDDGTKTVVKCQEGDIYDIEKGILYAVLRKVYGEGRNYTKILDIINKTCEDYNFGLYKV